MPAVDRSGHFSFQPEAAMTTTVTITTHSWPVEVTTTDDYDLESGHVYHAATSTMGPNSSQTFHLSSTRSLSFRELPIPHTNAEQAAE
jgi:hypothetical protein